MAANNSVSGEQRQDFQLDFGLYNQNGDNNLIVNGTSQATPNDNVEKFSNGNIGSSCGSTTKPSLNQVNFNMNLSISSTPRNLVPMENFQLSLQSFEEPSTPQSRTPRIELNPIVSVGNNQVDQPDFMSRPNHRCVLATETMINVTTDVNAPNMMKVEVEAPPQPYAPRQAEMIMRNTGILVEPFPPHHEPQSASQAELLQPQMAVPINQSCTFYGNQFGLNIQHNHMINSFGDQQAHLYQLSYPQTTMGALDGRSSWNNQQQQWFSISYNTAPHRLINTTPSGPRYNQFMRANFYGSPSSTILSNDSSLQSRHMQPTIWNQFPNMSNTYDPRYHTYSMAPRFQGFSYPYKHQASMASNFYETRGQNFMAPPNHSFRERPQSFGHCQVPYGMNPQYYNSPFHGSSMPSRFQQFNGYNQHINSVNYDVPNVFESQNYINPSQVPLRLTGPAQLNDIQQEIMTHGSQNQHFSVASETVPIMSSFSQLMDVAEVNGSISAMPQLAHPLQDSFTVSESSATSKPLTNLHHEQFVNQNHRSLVSEAREERVRGRRSCRRNYFEFGESSSSSSKRIKRESTTTEPSPLGLSPRRVYAQQNEWTSRVSNNRAIKSEIYNPMFEEMGLPIDPHLRMFILS